MNQLNPRVKEVLANDDYTINLIFDNGEKGLFDVKPYLEMGIFKQLKDINNFKSVKACMGTIQWEQGQDLCPDTLYLDSVKENIKLTA